MITKIIIGVALVLVSFILMVLGQKYLGEEQGRDPKHGKKAVADSHGDRIIHAGHALYANQHLPNRQKRPVTIRILSDVAWRPPIQSFASHITPL